MATHSDFYSIVVLGAMNPRIHHPAWYQLVELLDKDEAAEALNHVGTFCLPPAAQFEANGIKVVCQEGRWEVQTTRADQLERLQNLAGTVFDDLLSHTPVSAFGFNFNFRRTTGCESVGQELSSNASRMDLGFPTESLTSAEITLRRELDDHVISTTVKPGQSPSSINILSNFHYPLAAAKPGFFHLQDRFRARFEFDRRDAIETMERILSKLTSSE